MAKILVVEDTSDTLNLIRIKLTKAGHQVLTATDGEAALQLTFQFRPQLVVLDVTLPKLDGFSVARRLRNTSITRHVAILMLTARSQIADKVTGYEAGADDYLTKPFDPAELEMRVRTLLSRVAPGREAEAGGPKGKMISVFSLRGGVGKTSLTVNLAVTLAQLWNQPIPIFDLALQNGQAAIFLGLHPKATIDDLIDHWQEYPDADSLHEFFTVKEGLVRLLAAPRHPYGAERVSADMLKHLIKLVRAQSLFLLADVGSQLNDASLAALDASDLILLMLAPEVASVQTAVETLDTFGALDFPKEKVRLVLNRIFARPALASDQVESAIGVKISLVIPNEPELIGYAINTGEPYVLLSPNGAVARVIQDFAFSLGQPEGVDNEELTPLAKTVQGRMKAKLQ
jgi:pilus assembly protein CpaE